MELKKSHKTSKETRRKIGEANSHKNWKDSKLRKSKKGYLTLSFRGKDWKEHHLVYMEYHHLTEIPKGFVIHHINGIKDDNRIENLLLMPFGEHTRLHNLINYPKGSYIGKNKNMEKIKSQE